MWFSIVILRSMSSMFKSSQSRHSYPFCNISNSHFSLTPLSSPFSNTFSTGFKSEKQERHDKHDKHDKHNKQTTDLKAFKEKYHINDENQLSCFQLMHLPQPKLFISLSELNSVDFPMISYTISELVNFSKMIIEANPERRAIGKAFNLNKLIQLISENYLVTAYHNFTHAFSLLLLLFQTYKRCANVRSLITEKQWFYVFIAALMHDLKHPGTVNTFEVKSKSHLAAEAGNVAVLQKMHLTQFWNLLKKNSQVNFLQGYASYEAANIKNMISKMVFATDVSSHFKNLDVLREVSKSPVLEPKDSMFVVEQLFHACDIGNPCLDTPNYLNWAALVTFEFDQVARKEKELGLEVTSFLKYDNIKKFYGSQIGFCKGLVLPIWKELHNILPGIQQMHHNIESNIVELERRTQELSQS